MKVDRFTYNFWMWVSGILTGYAMLWLIVQWYFPAWSEETQHYVAIALAFVILAGIIYRRYKR
tara:strand:- start:260 stop:448 length:189 start_codon:yes stop_codon:yes gene_type:complete